MSFRLPCPKTDEHTNIDNLHCLFHLAKNLEDAGLRVEHAGASGVIRLEVSLEDDQIWEALALLWPNNLPETRGPYSEHRIVSASALWHNHLIHIWSCTTGPSAEAAA